jgi:hypothetical protein
VEYKAGSNFIDKVKFLHFKDEETEAKVTSRFPRGISVVSVAHLEIHKP